MEERRKTGSRSFRCQHEPYDHEDTTHNGGRECTPSHLPSAREADGQLTVQQREQLGQGSS